MRIEIAIAVVLLIGWGGAIIAAARSAYRHGFEEGYKQGVEDNP